MRVSHVLKASRIKELWEMLYIPIHLKANNEVAHTYEHCQFLEELSTLVSVKQTCAMKFMTGLLSTSFRSGFNDIVRLCVLTSIIEQQDSQHLCSMDSEVQVVYGNKATYLPFLSNGL